MNLPNKPIRTRFAPSPTGYLHVGGARTALFCWLYARRHGGSFVLRIEDTDRERSTQASIQAILDSMEWLGLDYDEGPYYQTERMARYQEVIQKLLEEGHAYRCFCSKARIEALREKQLANKEKPRYDGHCRDKRLGDSDEPHVIRFKNPAEGEVTFEDLVRGEISVANAELDDLIIQRSDRTPTYNFCVVVDDSDMEITHVIRGDDHINNTPRQINIFKALGMDVPHFAHVPMILGGDGKRLSKRHGAVSVLQYREAGYLPVALLNYLARLGWSHGDQEIFSTEELTELFDLSSVNRASAAFNHEKLAWLNQHYLKTLDPSVIAKPFTEQLHHLDVDTINGPDVGAVIAIQAERTKTLEEMADRSRYFYQDLFDYEEKAANKHLKPVVEKALRDAREKMAALSAWEKDPIHQVILDVAEAHELKLGKLAQPIRVAVTGGTVSPPIDITLELIGRDRVLERFDRALEFIVARGTE